MLPMLMPKNGTRTNRSFILYKSRCFSHPYFTVSSTTACSEVREHSVMKHSPIKVLVRTIFCYNVFVTSPAKPKLSPPAVQREG